MTFERSQQSLGQFWDAVDHDTGESFAQYWNRMEYNPAVAVRAFENARYVQSKFPRPF